MNHKTIHNQLIFYLEGTLPESEMKCISEHLEECTDCRLFFDELKLNWQLMEQDKTIEASPYFYSKVKNKVENDGQLVVHWYSRILQPVFFVFILGIGINFGIWMGTLYSESDTFVSQEASLLLLDDMSQEPIEQFLINFE